MCTGWFWRTVDLPGPFIRAVSAVWHHLLGWWLWREGKARRLHTGHRLLWLGHDRDTEWVAQHVAHTTETKNISTTKGLNPPTLSAQWKATKPAKADLHFILQIPESFGSREPTCPELLKTSDLSEEQQMSEFNTLCHYYTLSCSSILDPSACQRLAQDKCQSRFKKCRKLSRHFNLKNVHILTTFAFNEVLVWMCILIFYYY